VPRLAEPLAPSAHASAVNGLFCFFPCLCLEYWRPHMTTWILWKATMYVMWNQVFTYSIITKNTHRFGSIDWQVPLFLISKAFTQIFSFINVQLFNRYGFTLCSISAALHSLIRVRLKVSFSCSLLLQRKCCSFSNGEYMKARYFFYYYDTNNMLAYWLSILEMLKSSVN
jgi:hypothetical protein